MSYGDKKSRGGSRAGRAGRDCNWMMREIGAFLRESVGVVTFLESPHALILIAPGQRERRIHIQGISSTLD